MYFDNVLLNAYLINKIIIIKEYIEYIYYMTIYAVISIMHTRSFGDKTIISHQYIAYY